MNDPRNPKAGLDALLTPENCAFEGGHFLLEEHGEAVATLMRKFLLAQRDAQRR